MRLLKPLLKWTLMTIISACLAAIIYIMSLSSSDLNSMLCNFVDKHTAYELNLGDDTKFQWNNRLEIHAHQIHLQAKKDHQALIKADSARFSLNLRRLALGQVVIQEIDINSPQITLFKNKKTKFMPPNTSFTQARELFQAEQSVVESKADDTQQARKTSPQTVQSVTELKKEDTEQATQQHDVSPPNQTWMINLVHIHNGMITYKNQQDQIIYQIDGLEIDNEGLSLDPTKFSGQMSDWSFHLSTHGKLAIKQWNLGPWALNDIKLFYNINHGKISLSPILYQFNHASGKASGLLHYEEGHWIAQLKNHIDKASISAKDLNNNSKQSAISFASLPLLFDIDHGKVSINTDISAIFDDFDDLDSHINGTIDLKLTEGKIKRFNLGYELQRLEDRVNRIEDSAPAKTDGTEFNEFSINMQIENGKTKPFPVVLDSKDFSFQGMAQIDMVQDPAWMTMRVYIKPQSGRFPKLEGVLNQYLNGSHQGAIPLEFSSPLYKPSQMVITVDTEIVEKVLNDFFASWPEGVKNKIVNKLQGKLKKSLIKMQKRLNEGNQT